MGEATAAAESAEQDHGRAAMEAAAADRELNGRDERAALDFLLGAARPAEYTVKLDYDTPDGIKPLEWRIRAMDGRKIDEIEERNRSDVSGRMDVVAAACQIVAEATVYIEDSTGERTSPSDDAFMTVKALRRSTGREEEHRLASPADAIEMRFKTQLGLINGLAQEVRRVSGWDPERVGKASRVMVEAAGNS